MVRALCGRVALLGLLLVLSGCWDRHELNEMCIVVGIGIDKQGSNYKITVQTVNPGQVAAKKAAGTNASPVVVYEETGATVPEALSRMTVKVPRHLYYAHLRMVVIGEDAAKTGIGKPLDYLSRNEEMRTDFYFVVAKEATASEVLSILSSMDPIPANNMYTKLETSDNYWAATGSMNLNRLLQDLSAGGKSPTMTGVKIVGNAQQGTMTANRQHSEPAALLKYAGMAVFKLDKMTGWLDEDDTKALNYVQDSIHQTTGFIPCPGDTGYVTMQVIRSRTNIEPSIRDGKPEFDVYVTLEQDIADAECKLDLSQASVVTELTKRSDAKIKNFIETSVKKIQDKTGSDIYGFGYVLHQRYPREWSRISDWNETFRTADVRVHVNTTIRRIGTIIQPIKQMTK